ncbi:hypothetical protein MP228_005627 [Amoeboaphelidium protococcarum]|nr:hypothetical protein MP228_005627 [Amoeboaphelidium protococcarum]
MTLKVNLELLKSLKQKLQLRNSINITLNDLECLVGSSAMSGNATRDVSLQYDNGGDGQQRNPFLSGNVNWCRSHIQPPLISEQLSRHLQENIKRISSTFDMTSTAASSHGRDLLINSLLTEACLPLKDNIDSRISYAAQKQLDLYRVGIQQTVHHDFVVKQKQFQQQNVEYNDRYRFQCDYMVSPQMEVKELSKQYRPQPLNALLVQYKQAQQQQQQYKNDIKTDGPDLQRATCLIEKVADLPSSADFDLARDYIHSTAMYYRLIHGRSMPLNIIFTDGFGWQFIRVYLKKYAANKLSISSEDIARYLVYLQNASNVPKDEMLQSIIDNTQNNHYQQNNQLYKSLLADRKKQKVNAYYTLRLAGGVEDMIAFSSPVYNILHDETNLVVHTLRFWLKGMIPINQYFEVYN